MGGSLPWSSCVISASVTGRHAPSSRSPSISDPMDWRWMPVTWHHTSPRSAATRTWYDAARPARLLNVRGARVPPSCAESGGTCPRTSRHALGWSTPPARLGCARVPRVLASTWSHLPATRRGGTQPPPGNCHRTLSRPPTPPKGTLTVYKCLSQRYRAPRVMIANAPRTPSPSCASGKSPYGPACLWRPCYQGITPVRRACVSRCGPGGARTHRLTALRHEQQPGRHLVQASSLRQHTAHV